MLHVHYLHTAIKYIVLTPSKKKKNERQNKRYKIPQIPPNPHSPCPESSAKGSGYPSESSVTHLAVNTCDCCPNCQKNRLKNSLQFPSVPYHQAGKKHTGPTKHRDDSGICRSRPRTVSLSEQSCKTFMPNILRTRPFADHKNTNLYRT